MISTLDSIVQEVLDSSPLNLNIYAIEVIDEGYKCWCFNTHYLTLNSTITLSSVDYKVAEISQNTYVTLEGDSAPAQGSNPIPQMTYKWGRFNQVNLEISKDNSAIPMIWRFDLQDRTVNYDDNINASEGQARFFFIQTTNFQGYTTEFDYNYILNPLQSYVDNFVEDLSNHRLIGKLTTASRIKHPKFLTSNGAVGKDTSTNVFDRYVSAIELTINLPIRKDLTCRTRFIPVVEGEGFNIGFDKTAFK